MSLNEFPFTQQSFPQSNNVYHMRTKTDLVTYPHLALWSPVLDTLVKAIKAGYLTTFPGLTAQAVRKHLPKSIPTHKGHMRKARKNVRSTKSTLTTINEPEMTAPDFPQEPSARTSLVTCKVVKIEEPTVMLATDQTGRFLYRSSQGNLYVMVAYVKDANAIITVLLKKNRAETTLVNAYSEVYNGLCDRGLNPNLQICGNE